MALKQDDLAKVLVKLKIAADETAAKKMITEQQEHAVAVPDGTMVFNKDELKARDDQQYGNGKKAGEGMTIDSIFTKELPEYSGKKDGETLVAELFKKAEKNGNISVDEKVKERDTTIGKLRENIKAIEKEKADFQVKQQQLQRQATLLTMTIDQKPDNWPNDRWLRLIEGENELVEENGQQFVKRGGEVVKDPKLLTPIPAKDALAGWIKEQGIGKTPATNGGAGGRGDGDSHKPAAGIRTMSQFRTHLSEKGINEKSQEAQTLLESITKDTADFDYKN